MFIPQVGDIVLHKLKEFETVSYATMSHHWIFWGRERTSSIRNSELDLWRILEYSGHLIILPFKGPKLIYFGSNDEGRGKRDLSDLSRFSPTKQPPKKSKLLLKLAYEKVAKYIWLVYVFDFLSVPQGCSQQWICTCGKELLWFPLKNRRLYCFLSLLARWSCWK